MLEEHEIESKIINDEIGELHEGWRINDDSSADWAIEKITAIDAEYRRKEMVARNKIKQTEEWLAKEKAWAEQQKSFFTEKLKEYFDELPDEFIKKTKTQRIYKLPSGTLRLKAQSAEFKRDEEKLLQWVKANKPRLIRTKEYVEWMPLKELLAINGDRAIDLQTGEIVDGITVVNRDPKFEVDIK
jgi:phage host-nuclease inhibitor protein Gam